MPDIELKLTRVEQLFDTFDPAPFHAKALDRDAADYLRESAGEPASPKNLAIVIRGPATMAEALDDMTAAIHGHFALELRQAERRHRRRKRIGRIAMFGGVAILGIALLLRDAVTTIGGSGADVLAEGLLILAWVALWRPIETIGFDSWESRAERRLLSALATVPVRFACADTATQPPIGADVVAS